MLSTSSPDPLETIRRLEEDAKGVLDFFQVNQLFANPSKTAFLMIEPGQNHDGGYTIQIGNVRITESNVEKILGVEVDNKLTWDDQNCERAFPDTWAHPRTGVIVTSQFGIVESTMRIVQVAFQIMQLQLEM